MKPPEHEAGGADDGSSRGTPSVDAVLCDLDGTLYIGDELIPGAADAITCLRTHGVSLRVVTNTTTRSLSAVHDKVRALGLPIERDEILSALGAAVLHLRRLGSPTCHLVLRDEAKVDFAEFTQRQDAPDVIVIGDVGSAWSYALIQRLFRQVSSGAALVALHKGRSFQTPEGLSIDVGAFVTALEYATGVDATVVGKPSREFFELALEDLGVTPSRAVMVGDDIRSDVGGARAVGLRGILVRTGKYRDADAARSGVTPDEVIPSIADLPRAIGLG